MRRLRLVLTAIVLLAAGTSAARADPITAAIGSFVTFLGSGTLAAAAARIAIGIGLSFIAQLLRPKSGAAIGGASGTVQTGGTVDRSFVLGRKDVAGSIAYRNSFGASGKTPNAYYVRVIALADLPGHALAGILVNGAAMTWSPLATPSAEGIAIPEYTVSGKEHLWVRYYDGTQTTADARLVSLFASDPDRPYTARRIGKGVAYVVMTALVDPELFPGWPDFRFILDGPPVYDRRFDDEAGGEGDQRLATAATWTRSRNNIVNVAAALRGFRYAGTWVWGGQTVSEAQIPSASLFAASNECDVAIALKGGGTEPQFECGVEVRFSDEPADVIDALCRGCAGRIAEIGGVYKFRVGTAGVAVFTFSDGDILSTESQSREPFPSLAQVVNAVTAKYVSPADGWKDKDATRILRPDLEDDDDGRRHVLDLALGTVQSATQAQRLMKEALAYERAWTRHALSMPPDAQVLEPLDVVAGTSARYGYDAKPFDVERVRDLPDLNVVLGIKETDATGGDWDPDTDELPVTAAPPITIGLPPPQPISGWSADGVYVVGDNGQRLAGVRFEWATDVDDVVGVRWQVRLKSNQALKLDATTAAWEDGVAETAQNLVSITKYQARGKYIPDSDRQTEWSEWLDFETPDARVSLAEIDDSIQALFHQLDVTKDAALGPVDDELRRRLDELGHTVSGLTALLHERIEGSIVNYIGVANASITEIRTAVEGLADLFINVFVGNDIRQGNALFRMTAGDGPDGVAAEIVLAVRAAIAAVFDEALIRLQAGVTALGGGSRIVVSGGRILFTNAAGDLDTAIGIISDVDNVPMLEGLRVRPGSISDPRTTVNTSTTDVTYSAVGTGNIIQDALDLADFALEVDVDAYVQAVHVRVSITGINIGMGTGTGTRRFILLGFLKRNGSATTAGLVNILDSDLVTGGVSRFQPIEFTFVDVAPPAGTHTYTFALRLNQVQGSAGTRNYSLSVQDGGARMSSELKRF